MARNYGGAIQIGLPDLPGLQELRRRWLLQVRGCAHDIGPAAAMPQPPLQPPPLPPPQLRQALPAFLVAVAQGGAWPTMACGVLVAGAHLGGLERPAR